jgi:Zn-dependent protease
MTATRDGSFRLFRVAGIDVYLHWSWLLVAFFQVRYRGEFSRYDSPIWNLIEYLSLFGIVLVHEFGHVLACRQVGGIAERIVLWPLGGVAFVNPPPQPGAVLWSIAAGPLVNVFLVPVTVGLCLASMLLHWGDVNPDFAQYLQMLMKINLGLLIFNLLPIYPLDGGQILQALLWFGVGRANSLMVVSILGLLGGGCLFILALLAAMQGAEGAWWLVVIAAFMAIQAVAGFQKGRLLSRILSGPRHTEAACPSCGAAPLVGKFWRCDECGTAFDTFEHRARCSNCSKLFKVTRCPECYKQHPIEEWFAAAQARDHYAHYAPR